MEEYTTIKNKVISTTCPGYSIPECWFMEYVLPRMKSYGEKISVVDGLTGKSYTYNQLLDLSARMAGAFLKLGLKPGDIVCIHCRGILEFWVVFLGVVWAGGSVVLAKPSLNLREFLYILTDSKPAYIVAEDIYAEKVLEARKTAPFVRELISFGEASGFLNLDSLLEENAPFKEVKRSGDPKNTCIVIMYSSGTTGLPKGVQVSHSALLGIVHGASKAGRKLFSPEERILCVFPATHASGVWLGSGMLSAGSLQVMLPAFDVEKSFQLIEKYKITQLPLFPTVALQLVESPLRSKYDLSSVHTYLTGGSTTPETLFKKIIDVFKVKSLFHFYGMSEIGMSSTLAGSLEYKHCGKPLPAVDMKVIDVNTGEDLEAGRSGEICARGPQMMMGYLNRPEATRQTIDPEGWLHTGDVGYYDDQGNIYISDRLKDLIKCMDQQVAPAELEDILKAHPSIFQAAVVGVPHLKYGEAPRAYVVLFDDFQGKTTAQQIYDYVAEKCSKHKHLHGGIEFVKSIPVSETGKYLRRELRDEYVKTMNGVA